MNTLKNSSKIPWQNKPELCNDVLWRYSSNPIIDRYDIPSSNSIFNSAIVPFKNGFAGVFRCDNKAVQMNIFAGLFFFYVVWIIVRALNMTLLGFILGQILGVGVIAILIVFQQEIRRFLLFISSKYLSKNNFSLEKLINIKISTTATPTSVAARTCSGSTSQFQRFWAKWANPLPSSGIEPK